MCQSLTCVVPCSTKICIVEAFKYFGTKPKQRMLGTVSNWKCLHIHCYWVVCLHAMYLHALYIPCICTHCPFWSIVYEVFSTHFEMEKSQVTLPEISDV